MGQSAKKILDDKDMGRSLTRIAYEIIEKNGGSNDLVLLGIPTRGTFVADRIGQKISDSGSDISIGSLDVTMYRDDLHRQPTRTPKPSRIPPGGIDNKVVVLVDDVLFSGRTIRAALEALNDIGRPRLVQLAVLVDRGHRELPIRADFVGKNIPTSLQENVKVRLFEVDGEDSVIIGGEE